MLYSLGVNDKKAISRRSNTQSIAEKDSEASPG